MSDWTLKITRPCPTCKGGTEKPFRQWCHVCLRHFTPDELNNCTTLRGDDPMLPCGHRDVMLAESNDCDDCEDTGVEQRVVTLAEFAELLLEATDED